MDIIPNSASKNCGFGCDGKVIAIDKGRFPANVITDGSDEVAAGMPNTKSGNSLTYGSVRKKQTDNLYELGFSKKEKNDGQYAPDNYGDEGSAIRYFYQAKASKKDRDEGLDKYETLLTNIKRMAGMAIWINSSSLVKARNKIWGIVKANTALIMPMITFTFIVRINTSFRRCG